MKNPHLISNTIITMKSFAGCLSQPVTQRFSDKLQVPAMQITLPPCDANRVTGPGKQLYWPSRQGKFPHEQSTEAGEQGVSRTATPHATKWIKRSEGSRRTAKPF